MRKISSARPRRPGPVLVILRAELSSERERAGFSAQGRLWWRRGGRKRIHRGIAAMRVVLFTGIDLVACRAGAELARPERVAS